jgi:hypothetical protein
MAPHISAVLPPEPLTATAQLAPTVCAPMILNISGVFLTLCPPMTPHMSGVLPEASLSLMSGGEGPARSALTVNSSPCPAARRSRSDFSSIVAVCRYGGNHIFLGWLTRFIT